MRRFLSLLSIWIGLLAYCVGIFGAPLAVAATPPHGSGSGQALEIAPPLINLTVNPGQTITTKIQLRDVSKGQLLVTNQINDFVAAGEDGTPKILLKNRDDDNPYSLRHWIQPLPSLLLNPNQIKAIQITLHVPKSATPGGHYGVIRFSGVPPELKSTGVSLSASLGALMLVRVSGPVKEKLTLQQFSVAKLNKDGTAGASNSLFDAAPVAFVERIKNEGNIHEEPTGNVIVKNMFGKPVAGVNVNLPPRNILPASIRKFTQPLDKSVIGSKRLFGHYTATMTLNYGKDQKLTATTGFWVIPYKLMLGVIVLLVVGFFVLRTMIRRYNQTIINRAQGGKSRSRKQTPRKRKR